MRFWIISAVSGAHQGEQGGVLSNGQQLAVAQSPITWGKVSGEDPDFGDKWF